MSHIALYRKFRPSSFDEVKGQDHIVKTLKNQVKTDRLGHAYLFSGTRGTGKTSIAKIFAKTINCENAVDGQPCNACASCRSINEQTSLNVIEIDAASNNGVDNIRQIIDEVAYSPTEGKYKVYIIDEVHMLSAGAFNALLKTLEEPPSYVKFILATTEAHKIPVTILSRCQRYDFKRLTIDSIVGRLNELIEKENIQAEQKALTYMARCADGAMRDALSLLDQCISFYIGEELTYERVLEVLGQVDTDIFMKLLDNLINNKISESVKVVNELVADGKDLSQFVVNFTWFLRNVMIIKTSLQRDELVDLPKDKIDAIANMTVGIELDTIIRYIKVTSELTNKLRYSTSKRTLVEMTIIKLCTPQMEHNDEALYDRIAALERKLASGTFVTQTTGTQAQAGTIPSENEIESELEFIDVNSDMTREQVDAIIKATSEDVKELAANWGAVAAKLSMPVRMNLKSAKIYPGDDNTLIFYFKDAIGRDWALKEIQQVNIKDAIKSVTGKDVELKMICADNQEQIKGKVELSKLVNMKIDYIE